MLYTYNLEQRQESLQRAVKVDFCVHPAHALCLVTLVLSTDNWSIDHLQSLVIDTSVKLSAEQLKTNDAKDEPEDQAHKHHVDDRRNGMHQGIDDNLQW